MVAWMQAWQPPDAISYQLLPKGKLVNNGWRKPIPNSLSQIACHLEMSDRQRPDGVWDGSNTDQTNLTIHFLTQHASQNEVSAQRTWQAPSKDDLSTGQK